MKKEDILGVMMLLGISTIIFTIVLYIAMKFEKTKELSVQKTEIQFPPGSQYMISGGIFTVKCAIYDGRVVLVSSTGQEIYVYPNLLTQPVKVTAEGTTK